MPMLATLMRGSRLLALASGAIGVWLALAIVLSGGAMAHAGHRHVADATGAVLSPSLVSSASSVAASVIVEPAMGPAGGSISPPERNVGFTDLRLNTTAPMSMADVASSGLIVRCTCGGSCGNCTSVSCCSAALAPRSDEQVARFHLAVQLPARHATMIGAEVPPSPRPPIQIC
jgi:hypothetical protein